ncbi:MAG TPA: M23 family metallopeptidase [Cyclobacteriaceae bacterium]|nr:M23 family metallopeptidase [Cyclobacteriaceae bacterium]
MAQLSEPEIGLVKDEKYIYPVYPGQPGSLAGNMGELRSTHFHSGIDVRTNNQIGHPVVASKSGYISRVSMSPTGYGNVIFIKHPDGNTTLYGHLDHFEGDLANYVLNEQYKRKTFDIDLYPDENQFVVKQGEIIAISGNTGSSGGPHVHFDIRDSNMHALNPLKFGFSEIVDKTPPSVEKIAFIPLDINSRVDDRFGRQELYAYRSGNTYSISAPILASGNLGIEILAKDRFIPRGQFHGGVNYIEMRVDGRLVFKQSIDKINPEETRGIYTLMDYKALKTKGSRFYKLYIDDGNVLPFYGASPTSGKLLIHGSKEYKVEVLLKDVFGNASTANFKIKPSPVTKDVKTLQPFNFDPYYEVDENVMMITAKPWIEGGNKATLYTNDSVTQMEPSYASAGRTIFLVDLRKQMPDSVVVAGKTLVTHFKTIIPPATEYKYYSDKVDIEFPPNSLYDTLYLNASFKDDDTFTIGDRTIPLNQNIKISFSPSREYPNDKRYAVYRVVGKSNTYLGGERNNGRISFQSRELGNFAVLMDSISPTVYPISINNNTVRFKIRDDLSGIATYTANINGNWLLMHYDAKTATIWSERLSKTEPLSGEFELVVTDNAGNVQSFKTNIH